MVEVSHRLYRLSGTRIHAVVRGQGPGRRWYTSALNQGMFVALVAQFQTFSRELHDEAVQVIASEADQGI